MINFLKLLEINRYVYKYNSIKHYLTKLFLFIGGSIMAVKIDSEACGHIANCPVQGLCVKICEQNALIEEHGDVTIVQEKCDDCDLCIQNCPNQAISKA